MRTFVRWLFILVFLELSLGGGGRFTALGSVSLRMILFAVPAVTSVVIWMRGKRLPKTYVYLLVSFSTLLVLDLGVGILNDAPRLYWWEDIKPLSYFFILPFFYYASHEPTIIPDIRRIVCTSSLIQAVLFFILLVLIHSKLIPFLSFYHAVLPSGELFFRGETTFFYKGFLFLCIGLMFFYFSSRTFRWVAIVILSLAIVLSFTRGFVFALLLTAVVFQMINSRWKQAVFYLVVTGLFLVFSNRAISTLSAQFDRAKQSVNDNSKRSKNPTAPGTQLNTKLLGDRDYSDAGRFQQITEVLHAMTPGSLIVGHGFGIGVPSRPVHMEISYLEILHKQGVIGLAFWMILFLMIVRSYLRSDRSSEANALFCSAVFVFCQSLTNQYVNNPIGMSVVLVALVVLDSKISSGRRQVDVSFENKRRLRQKAES